LDSSHLVDPELIEALELIPTFTFSADTLADLRAQPLPAAYRPDDGSRPITVEEHSIAGPDGDPLRVVLYRPLGGAAVKPGYVQIHGGGYILGSPEGSDLRNRTLALETDTIVAAVDYRLAPETPHPGPVEDCYAALKWLHREAASLGVDPARIAVGGESAGGGLAAATCLLARDRGEVPVAFQHLIYPMIDDRTAAADPHPFAGQYVWTVQSNAFGWASLLAAPPGSPGVSHYASPARAEDLSGLPPTFIAVGALDLFIEEDLEYARRLIRAGVPTELHVYPGAYHAFIHMTGTDVTRRFVRDELDAVRRALRAA
jgi:acetyl esterase/lipase